MRVKDLAKIASVSEQAIQKRTKKAKDNNLNFIVLDGDKYLFEEAVDQKARGKVYQYFLEEVKKTGEEKEISKDFTYSSEYMKLPLEKRKDAEARLRFVKLYQNRGNLSAEKFIKKHYYRFEAISPNTQKLFRWVEIVNKAEETKVNPLHLLVDSRGAKPGTKKLSKAMQDDIVAMIIENPTRKTQRIYEYLLDIYGNVVSYATVNRFIQEWKGNQFLVYAFAENPNKAVGQYRPAPGKMDENISYRNQLWELDATPADVICSDGIRYTLSAAIDVYSRRPVVVVEESASYTTLGKMLKKAIQKLGVPETVKTDNGKDYTSNNFDYTCARLGINHELAPPYAGYMKPFIERFFKTLSHGLFEECEGYIGHNTGEREAITSRQTFQKQLEAQRRWREKAKDKNDFARRFAKKKENASIAVEIPLSRDELVEWIDKWISVYENRLHRGINETPLSRWNKSIEPVKRVSDERILNILVGFSITRRVTKKGIKWMAKSHYWANELYDFVGRTVYLLSDDDMGHIFVYDLDMNFICKAENPEMKNISRIEYAKSAKMFDRKTRKIIKLLAEIRDEAPKRMQEHIGKELEKINEVITTAIEVGYEHKNSAVDGVVEALKEKVPELEEYKEEKGITLNINGRPLFDSLYDRFYWCFETNTWNKEDQKLKEEHYLVYKKAQENFQLFIA